VSSRDLCLGRRWLFWKLLILKAKKKGKEEAFDAEFLSLDPFLLSV
jgi:hypothetical protein